ncbi:SusC/RagA family TonB-linked outer membrane protein [Flavivirga sp. 57AJ16]|uniref:SusC/RagA family TonB-linked outer membrane protein n=1 Tax=Flavivirga sp. 57AJ16 TaxID=3025307 RepID=UPI0023664614|nr:SusC/RagA family TonB-linked outer membrane protein [Flavivirga sp. 57AJ16]MDD7888226.1 SusC/RagA family TonB-linked outer membrane protein [Flavivirga sp. 57AJ16]
MRTFIFLLCTTVFSFNVETTLAQEKVTIDADKVVTVDEVFEIIIDQTKYRFMYPEDLFKDMPKVQLKKGTIRMDKLINQTISFGSFNVVLAENYTILIKEAKTQQQIKVTGQVTDESNQPIPGATVLIKGTTKGTATDFDGTYSITVPNPENVLVFSALGFETQEITVGNQNTINVSFKEDISELDQVTINAGYYKTSEKLRTGNISSITKKEIELQPVSNPIAVLQGRMPGVNVTQTSGLPGAGFDIQIRGQNSIAAGNDPLYIVDGVPFASEPINYLQTSGILGGTISPLNGINPADIEKIEVLKDSDATSIYGSRGANGVVLITTKKGVSGKAKLNIHFNTSMGRVTQFLDMLETPQYLEMRREAFVNDGRTPGTSDYDVNGTWDQNRYTDWQKELIGGTAYRTMGQVSVSGGSNNTRYLMSGTYQKETTVFPGETGYKKGSVLLNLDHNSEDGRFNIHFSGNYVVDDNNLPAADLTRVSLNLAPNAPALYDDQGELNWENNTWNNPLADLESRFSSNSKTLITNSVISYAILEDLTIKANLGYTDSQMKDSRILPSTRYNPFYGADSRYSSVYQGTASRTSWIVEPQLQWKKDIGALKLDVLLGGTFQQQKQEQLGLYGSDYPSNELLDNISAASTLIINLDSDSEYNYQAVFGRINLNYNQKYILNFTGRRDGSSRFGTNRQFANFGAVGAAWLFSEERFIKESFPIISYGKLRGSYGTTGNDKIGDYQFLETYSLGSTNYDGVTVLSPSRLFNPNFGWERNEKLEIGLELGLWNDKVLLSSSYYRNRSSNQLVGIPMPGTTGFNSLQANLDATVQNTGLEIEASSRLVNTDKIRWNISLNLSFPENELLSFPGLEASTYANRLVVGYPLDIRKMYFSTGVDPATGIYQFRDYDQDGNISSPNDKQYIADFNPEFYGGLSNNFSIGSFEVDFLFQFTKQQNLNYLFNSGFSGSMANRPVDVLDRWRQDGDSATSQIYTTGSNSQAVSAFFRYSDSNKAVSDTSYIRLKTMSIGYNVPSRYMKGMNCRVYLQGQNLLTWTSYKWGDPEFVGGGRLPQLRQFTLGTQITF